MLKQNGASLYIVPILTGVTQACTQEGRSQFTGGTSVGRRADLVQVDGKAHLTHAHLL